MTKRALMILADGFEEIEAVTPVDILRRGGIEVVIAGLQNREVKSTRNVTILADKKLEDAGIDFDCLILPGGSCGAKNLAASEKVKDLILSMNRAGKIIAAICASPAFVLAPLGVLKGKKATSFPTLEKGFPRDVKFSGENVVVDGNIITSRAAGTTGEFSFAILAKLAGPDAVQKVKKATLFDGV